jgi:hypothetical protein
MLKAATSRLTHPIDHHRSRATPSLPSARACASSPMPSEARGPTTDVSSSCHGVRLSPSIAVSPPSRCNVTDGTRMPNARATPRCASSCTSTDT